MFSFWEDDSHPLHASVTRALQLRPQAQVGADASAQPGYVHPIQRMSYSMNMKRQIPVGYGPTRTRCTKVFCAQSFSSLHVFHSSLLALAISSFSKTTTSHGYESRVALRRGLFDTCMKSPECCGTLGHSAMNACVAARQVQSTAAKRPSRRPWCSRLQIVLYAAFLQGSRSGQRTSDALVYECRAGGTPPQITPVATALDLLVPVVQEYFTHSRPSQTHETREGCTTACFAGPTGPLGLGALSGCWRRPAH